jgi:oligopeptide transport system ATP-binding protein
LSIDEALVVVDQIVVSFPYRNRENDVVKSVSFSINPGARVGLVGESGSGKSLTARAMMNLIPSPGRISHGRVLFKGMPLGIGDFADPTTWRGTAIAMLTQDPLSSLNPLVRIGTQMTEMLIHHRGMKLDQAKARAAELLTAVGIANPRRTLRQFPNVLSGGMRQRVALAIAISCDPQLLIADEPTTALDVTIQAQVLDLLEKMTREKGTAVLLISHDLAVVANFCDELIVMYGGRIVESAKCDVLIATPMHPYTQALIASIPDLSGDIPHRLASIPGTPPSGTEADEGCSFAPRCHLAQEICFSQTPTLVRELQSSRQVACHMADTDGWFSNEVIGVGK